MNWRTLMKEGETHTNIPKIPKINPTRPLEGGFEDIGEVLDEVKAPTPGQQPTQKSGGKAPVNSIKVGSCVWYCVPGYPKKGPCRVTLLDEGWHMVQIVENEELVWIHQCLIVALS